MRFLSACFAPLLLAVALPAAAAPKTTAPPANAAPKELGQFKNWIAATHTESGHTVCYAFTRAGN